jgi:hypothetical protein
MNVPHASDAAKAHFDALVADLAARGVTRVSWFGLPAMKAGRKIASALWGDALVVKLPHDELARVLELDGAERFEPMLDCVMKSWVAVPLSHVDRWEGLAEAAVDHVTGGTT